MKGSDLEGTSARDNGAIIESVLNGSQAIPDGVLDLGQGVVVRALYQNGAGGGVGDFLHKRKLVLTQHVLVHQARVAKAVRAQLLHRVHGVSCPHATQIRFSQAKTVRPVSTPEKAPEDSKHSHTPLQLAASPKKR